MPKRRVSRHLVTQPVDKPYRLIPLTQGQNAIVDAEDFEWLSQWNWFAHWDKRLKGFYAKCSAMFGKSVGMHRVILECGPREQADHINHNTLDNRRQNLRKCTRAQNKRNTQWYSNNSSGFKGVSWHKKMRMWSARIGVNGRKRWIGAYHSKEEAALAYNQAAKEFYGEFAHQNFLPRT